MRRKLGRSGIDVSALGMGCWAIGGPFWEGKDALGWSKVDDNESIKAVQKALDLGINFFDTADVYGAGHSERVLAKAFGDQRKNVIIATKFGLTFDESSKQVTGTDTSAAYIRKACENSLKRLNTDYIDLYQFHLNDFDAEKAIEIRETLEQLVQQGKIRFYGWSTDFIDQATVFESGKHCTTIQFEQNVLDQNPKLNEFCEQKNLAGINRGPLAMGLLSGKYDHKAQLADDDVRGQNSPGWMQYFKEGQVSDQWLKKMQAIREILSSDGRTLIQGALAAIWALSDNTIPIPGFKNSAQVMENASAMNFGALNDEQMEQIERLVNID